MEITAKFSNNSENSSNKNESKIEKYSFQNLIASANRSYEMLQSKIRQAEPIQKEINIPKTNYISDWYVA